MSPWKWLRAVPFVLALGAGLAVSARAAGPLDPKEVRAAAVEAGLGSLASVTPPTPEGIDRFIQPGDVAKLAAQQLGKALFWDTQVGSDGQACASCHFHAGADVRAKNQINPGADKQFSPRLGPNATVTAADFPFHHVADPTEANYDAKEILRSVDDAMTSQGVSSARFDGAVPGAAADAGTPVPDPVFSVGGVNVRRAEPRQAPSVINAVFNVANFWDGRAQGVFNGATPFGPLDPGARVWAAHGGPIVPERIALPDSSLASQAVAPPTDTNEMSFTGRSFPELGRKLLDRRPLAFQQVEADDSLLGPLAAGGGPGLDTTYQELIRRAFQAEWWSGTGTVDGYRQIEANFPLFFGLAIQEYESLLVSDQTSFDRFMGGDDDALTPQQLRGLTIFINGPDAPASPMLQGVAKGNCVACHSGPELTAAGISAAAAPTKVAPVSELVEGALQVGDATGWADTGFDNIGIRPTGEDLGRGGVVEGDRPLSFTRQALAGVPNAPALARCGADGELPCPPPGRTLVDGAFKTPGLRNVELTGPYFHNGGAATLMQALEVYDRAGDFGDVNLTDMASAMAGIRFANEDKPPLVAFLRALTDDRVRWESAPFDHPELAIPDGSPGDRNSILCAVGIVACDNTLEVPATGSGGRRAAGLPPLGTFLDLDPAAGSAFR